MYFLDPSLLAKHTPLITTASPGNYENPPRINQMQKSVNQKYTVRHLIVALQFYQIPFAWGRTAIHVKCRLTGLFLVQAFQNSVI